MRTENGRRKLLCTSALQLRQYQKSLSDTLSDEKSLFEKQVESSLRSQHARQASTN